MAEEVKKENNEIPTVSTPIESKEEKKPRKKFEWTPKRLEAFNKMREGLETKNEIAKKLKEEKSKSEKDAIKKRVREIMNLSSAAKEMEEASASESSEEESEEEKPVKKLSKATKKAPKKEKEKKKKRKPVVVESESSEEEEESSDEEVSPAFLSKKQREKVTEMKAKTGKVNKTVPLHNPWDNYILL